MKSGVLVSRPVSFDWINFLKALSAQNKNFFTVINPASSLSLGDQLLDLQELGISFSGPQAKREVGFKVESVGHSEKGLYYKINATLVLTPVPAGTMKDIDFEVWKMFIDDADDERHFFIASALQDHFGIRMFLHPYSMDDKDDHMEPVPVNKAFPDGPITMCEILPRIKEKE